MLCLLIDGYNLLHATERGFIKDLQEKRDDLLARLHHYQVQKKVQMTVVFDATAPSAGFLNRDKLGELQIVYTDAHSTADEWIANACEKKPGSYVVVSSDNQVVRDAERFGCITMSSPEFAKKISQVQAPIENPYFEDKVEEEDEPGLYPKVSTKKKGASKRLPKKERRKLHQLKNL